ncbi:unnamed protein product [Caenorhabditis bovis]|uniref:Uncharacterized protein n=1 Tax=Caenorhabditis bovis TaxID=2654633 RepID=A0A8S1F656_9PELO|nr:unnamed protein product [Caenorhabditis bovis]
MMILMLSTGLFALPASQEFKNETCTENGVTVNVMNSEKIEVCTESYCTRRDSPTIENVTDVWLPPTIKRLAHELRIKRLQGNTITISTIRCPAVSFCKTIDCTWCMANIANPECHPLFAITGAIVLLYLLLTMIYVVSSVPIRLGQATNMTSETSFSYTIPTNLNAYQLERRSLKIKEIFTNVVKTVRQLQEEAERADKIITTTTMTEREMVASTRDVTKLYRMAQKGFDRLLDQTVRLTNVFHQYLDANQKVRDLIDLAVVDALDVAVRMDQTGAAERDISDQYRAITNRTKVLMDQLREVIQQSRERQLEKNEQELRQWHRFIVRAEIGVQEILTTTQETWKSTKQMFTTTYDHTNQTLRALLKIRRSRQEMQQDLLLLLKDPRGRSNNPPYVTVPESNKPIPRRIVELL